MRVINKQLKDYENRLLIELNLVSLKFIQH
jgi:hypothetical protein